jgi:hypothetical protein
MYVVEWAKKADMAPSTATALFNEGVKTKKDLIRLSMK